MKASEFKEKINLIFERSLKFDGHIEKVIENIDEDRQIQIILWVENCKKGIERPEPCKRFNNLICFIYKSRDNKIRGILTKEKNSYFIELFIDKHKYYDQKRRYLGL